MSDSNELLDGINSIGKKIDLSVEEGKALAARQVSLESKYAEAEKIIAEQKKAHDEYVAEQTKKMADQGKTIGEITEKLDSINKKAGEIGVGSSSNQVKATDLINEIFEQHVEEFKGIGKNQTMKFETKANITNALLSTTGTATSIPYSYADFGPVTRPTRKINIRDIVPVINSATGTFVYYKQATPVGAGSFGFQAGQGNVKAALDYSLIQVIVSTDYLAGTARVARQMLTDLPYMQSFISQQLLEDYRRSESGAFMPILSANSTAFSPAATVTAEQIIQAIADLLGKDFSPNGIITDAPTWAKIMNTKPSNYSLPGGGAAVTVDADGTVRFVGIPVLVQNNGVAGQVIIGDFTKAAIIQTEGLSVDFFNQDQDNVVRNLVTVRVEARVAFAVLNSLAFDKFTAGT